MNVKRLDGRLLNFWVAKSAGLHLSTNGANPTKGHDPDSGFWHPHTYNPANDWALAGPIIAAEWFAIEDMLLEWFGAHWPHIPAITDNPLKWFLRAYVATQFGDEVEEVTSPTALHFSNDLDATTLTPSQPHAGSQSLVQSILKQFSW